MKGYWGNPDMLCTSISVPLFAGNHELLIAYGPGTPASLHMMCAPTFWPESGLASIALLNLSKGL